MLVPVMHLFTVAQAMIRASSPGSEWNSIFLNTAGIVFLGTPHRYSPSAHGPWLLIRFFLCLPSPPLVHLLRANSSLLARIADQFNNIWGSRRIFSFYETKAMIRSKVVIQHSTFLQHLSQQLLYCQIVPREDAITNCPEEQIRDVPDCDHAQLCKPDSAQSDLFTKVLEAIQSLLPQVSRVAAAAAAMTPAGGAGGAATSTGAAEGPAGPAAD